MTSRLAKCLTAALLFCLTQAASAGATPIDLFDTAGVAGTGGYSTVIGPCYCDQQALFSPILLLQPGTYDFGTVREYWVQSGFTPDGGIDQPNGYLLFSPVESSAWYPDDFPPPATSAFPAVDLCNQEDVACNAKYVGAFTDFDLIYTLPAGQNAVQIGLIGNFVYTPPVPEPLACATFALGLALVAGISRKRRTALAPI